MGEKITPCPFCGGRDIRHGAYTVGRQCVCMTCRATGPANLVKGGNAADTDRKRRDESYRLWNRRTKADQ